MEDIVVPIAVFGSIALIVKMVLDYKTRIKLIEKGEVNENIKHLFARYSSGNQRLTSLKWGLVLLGIGIAMLSKQFAPIYISDESVFGLMFLFAGIGFFLYYAVSGKFSKMNGNGDATN